MLVFLVSLVFVLCGCATAWDPAQDPPGAQDPAVAEGGTDQDPTAAQEAVSGDQEQDPERQQRDRITLPNGDVLRGDLLDFISGNITFHVDGLGDLEIDLDDIADLSTAGPVVVVTDDRSHVEGRIRSIVGNQLQMSLDDGSFTTIPLEDWDALRFPGGTGARWRGALSLGARISTGNTEERQLNTTLNFRRRTDTDRIIGAFNFFYNEDFNDVTGDYELDERRGLASLQYDYFLGPRAYAWATGSGGVDSEAEVDLRLILGGGGGYQFAESDNLNFEGLLGLAYYEKRYDTMEPNLEYLALRVGYNIDWEFLDGARFIQSLQALPSLENPDEDFYLRSDLRMRFNFWQGMFTEVQWILDYDTAPAMGRERFDSIITLNIGWSF